MNRSKYRIVFLFLAFISYIDMIHAQANKKIPLVTTSVPFMLISPDARSGGMGNLSLAMSPEANDLFGNTAKLPNLNCRILPADYKKIVTEKIDKYIETQPKFNKRFSELKNFMNSEDQIHLIPDFVAYHNKKDMHRNQSTVSVFPELASIFS